MTAIATRAGDDRAARLAAARRFAGRAAPPRRPLSARTASASARAAACSAPPSRRPRDPAFADMFDRGYAIVCRDAAVPVGQALRAARCGGGDPAARLAALRADEVTASAAERGRDRGPRRGRDAATAGSTTPTSPTASMLRRGAATRSTSPRGWPAMTARCGSACAASSPTGRSRARSRSPPPAPAIPPPSPGSRPGRSIRSARWPRPIAATMPAAMPRPPNSSPR